MPPQQPQLDQGAVNLAKAIRQTESGGDFNAKGKSGEQGAYQFTSDTWNAHAPKYGISVPIEKATPEQQNAVAYNLIKGWKDKGYDVTQIASMWNAGEAEPNAYSGKFGSTTPSHKAGDLATGVNKYGVKYDVPAYAKSVANAYLQLKNGGSVGVDPNNPSSIAAPQPKPEAGVSLLPNLGEIGKNLSSNLSGRAGDLSSALSTAGQGGLENIGSGLLQAGGAIAGGIGDIANAGLELIPGVQAAEKGIGAGIQGLAKTDLGQSLTQKYQEFAIAHPEAAKNLSASVNILSAIPILKGLSLAKTGIEDALTTGFRKSATTAAEQELRSAVKGKVASSLTRAEARGLNPIGKLINETNYLPDAIESAPGKFVFSSKTGAAALQDSLHADELALQQKLAPSGNILSTRIPYEDVKKKILSDVAKEYEYSGNYSDALKYTNSYLEDFKTSMGGKDFIDLDKLNALKRDIRSYVNFDNLGTQKSTLNYTIGQSVMDQVEQNAKKAGIQGVPELNKVMGEKIEMLKILKAIDSKPVKLLSKGKGATGLLRDVTSDVPVLRSLAKRYFAPSSGVQRLKSGVGVRGLLNATKTTSQGLLRSAKGVGLQKIAQTQSQGQ